MRGETLSKVLQKFKAKGIFMDENPEPRFEDLLEQLHKTLKDIQNFKGPHSKELASDIEKLESAVGIFKKESQELIDTLDIDMESLKHKVLDSSDVRSDEKQFIKQTGDIEKEARVLKSALAEAKEKRGDKRGNRTSSQNAERDQMKERKKLFKTIGGDKKWIPL